MKVNWIEFKSNKNITIEKTYFNNLALLVGISGAGKTQILKFINLFSLLMRGNNQKYLSKFLEDGRYCISFTIEGVEYQYEAEFGKKLINEEDVNEKLVTEEEYEGDSGFTILFEKLTANNKILFIKSNSESRFMEYSHIPKTVEDESLLKVFSQEEISKKLLKNIDNIYNLGDITGLQAKAFDKKRLDYYNNKFNNYDAICESHLPILMKYALIHKNYSEKFHSIKENYIDIFSNVEDIKFDFDSDNFYCLYIKEKKGNWVDQLNISQGMLKSLACLIAVNTLPKGAIVLIDEFENGLGVNCLDIITENIIDSCDNIQFIITSHHPYIINNISPENWKIVVRKQSTIKTKSAEDLGIGSTMYDSFFELINYLDYEGEL